MYIYIYLIIISVWYIIGVYYILYAFSYTTPIIRIICISSNCRVTYGTKRLPIYYNNVVMYTMYIIYSYASTNARMSVMYWCFIVLNSDSIVYTSWWFQIGLHSVFPLAMKLFKFWLLEYISILIKIPYFKKYRLKFLNRLRSVTWHNIGSYLKPYTDG
jgi:hypothetical protein